MKMGSTTILSVGLVLFICSLVIGECRQPATQKTIVLDAKFEAPVRAYLEVLKQKVER